MVEPPAPPWAVIYERIHENEFIPEWTTYVTFIKHFIADGCGFWTLQLRFQKRTLQSNLMNLSRGHEQKKGDFLELFGLPRNLGLKLSLDHKTWRKKNRKKNDDKYPIFDVKVGQQICLGALFSIRRFCTSVSLACALILPDSINKNIPAY